MTMDENGDIVGGWRHFGLSKKRIDHNKLVTEDLEAVVAEI